MIYIMFSMNQSIFGGLGISIMWLLYIKHPFNVQGFGTNLASWTIVFSSHAASVICTIQMMNVLSGSATSFSECLTPSTNQDHHNLTIRSMVLAFKAAAVLGEFLIYAIIVRTMYQQDLSMTSHIPDQALKKRHRRNAMSLLGHIVFFAIEMAFMVAIFIFNIVGRSQGYRNIKGISIPDLLLFKVIEQGILSTVMLGLNHELKVEFNALLCYVKQ